MYKIDRRGGGPKNSSLGQTRFFYNVNMDICNSTST